MIGLIPIHRVISWIAVAYAVVAIILYGAITLASGNTMSGWTAASFALSGSGLLQILLLTWIYYGWQQIWAWFPHLNKFLYPDIRGTWDMEIALGGNNQSARVIKATAVIRQNFLRISMDVEAPASTSATLAAFPKKHAESGLPQLYYFFLVSTRAEPGKPSKVYKGAAILDINHLGDGELRGGYWSASETSGHYRLYNRRSPT